MSLYSQSLGVAIAQTTYATDASGEIQALRQLLEAPTPSVERNAHRCKLLQSFSGRF